MDILPRDNLVAYGFNVNPVPWAIGPISVGYGPKGKMIPKVAPEATLQMMQNSIKAQLLEDGCVERPGKYALRFWFSRQLDKYIKLESEGTATRNQADGTNMMKGVEDSLQHVLIGNDRDVIRGEWIMAGPQTVETVPWIVVECIYGLTDYSLDKSAFPIGLTDQGLDAYRITRQREEKNANLEGIEWEA